MNLITAVFSEIAESLRDPAFLISLALTFAFLVAVLPRPRRALHIRLRSRGGNRNASV